ncbi:hypothetical protein CONPUDRAFT_88991 [Coniophora puteana RWD-64-598 SS2]|uniref:Uncharacterized protein n=1 Tax=Coniophora puteana (strain RWD-64-598) TaxID=741705 RepID=A0A5M3MW76_CONPW|nr:uncharacterized protein CONPUDRAFT_88991 [Coniophora puteana RWD-64-598 SS2]EIW82965.1 hypothetical protein CONPUDRAFT_88991 [Coniophora puteana RWD-64-598 SS2]
MLETLALQRDSQYPPKFIADGLCEVFSPFWADLLHTNIFRYISSDILHQIHQGVFKDHLLKWCTNLVNKNPNTNLDKQFEAIPPYAGLQHFKSGISGIKQWTMGEHKQVQCVFVAALAGSVESHTLTAAHALLNFIYLTQYYSHTTELLAAMQDALHCFYKDKDVFTEWNGNFNIPKLHSLLHYLKIILLLGSLNGLNTKNTEHLHIDFTK